jgi:hypothetical protein
LKEALKMLSQPYKLLLLTGVLLIIFSFFVFRKTLDIHIHDTYLVIASNIVCWTLAVALFVFSFIYWLANETLLSTFLTWTHVIFTLILTVLVVAAPNWLPLVEQSFSSDPFDAIGQKWKFYRNLQIIVLFLLAGQLAFLINLIGGLIKRYT